MDTGDFSAVCRTVIFVFFVFFVANLPWLRGMAEKAVDECEELGPINVFNAVTRQNDSSPAQSPSDGRSVGGGLEAAESGELSAESQKQGSIPGLALGSQPSAFSFLKP
jgi:hypothetical protein